MATEMTVYIAWGAQWDSNCDEFFGVYRTKEAAEKYLASLQRQDLMSKWVTEETVEE